ncbi:ELMO domain-containing protein 2 isoform X1 [Daphnia magna]|uniref:ELMO domain-containing protein 2 isoform X1 n=1 Tax=Daphnia magna TaxID=35525 RepID=UPI001E1BC4E1|nr:ELMO domain-containing protein 2 isoform X1 [Daphnia magna]XP_045029671.1 ELMO domain-containing protein 2 isoform X1 [Daphnia magna]
MFFQPISYISNFFGWLLSPLFNFIKRILRPFIKWILRQTTGLCELQRTCYCEPSGAPRILGIEDSLKQSKSVKVHTLLQFLDLAAREKRFTSVGSAKIIHNTVETICFIKKIHLDAHQPFTKLFGECVSIIWTLKQLLHDLENIRTTGYDSSNIEHEKKLLELWNLLMPMKELECRVSNLWKDIGFQGDDPKTDFRGMGLLGLENLHFFAKNYPEVALQVLSHSNHPIHGYSFAIVGINLTHLAYNLWKDGTAKSHIYNICCHQLQVPGPTLLHFHRFYCYLFIEFDKLWMAEKPATIMEFGRIRSNFENEIRLLLSYPNCLFKLNIPVEHV